MDTKTVAAVGLGAAIGAGACYLLLRSSSHTTLVKSTSTSQLSSTRINGSTATLGTSTSASSPNLKAAGAVAGASAKGGTTSSTVRRFQEDEVLVEQLTRNIQFFGADAQQLVAESFVVVVGLGGVGSHCAHLLLRSGVGKLRLIDFDQVTVSSLNRHAVATREDVGTPKATCLAKHFTRILPEAEVEAVVQMYTADKESELLAGSPTLVIDAIDNIDTKVALVAACVKRGIKCLSVAGAGAKADPTRLHIVDLGESACDPLAKALRYRLRKDHNIITGVPVLLSTEKPRCGLVACEEVEQGIRSPADFQVVPNFRVRTIPVLGTTPAVFGMAAAGWALCTLAGAPFETEPVIKLQEKQYEEQLRLLREREMARWGDACPPVPIDMDDVIYLVRELWRARSAREAGGPPRKPGGDWGLKRATGHLCLTRWDPAQPAHVDNLVLLTHEEADTHDAAASGPGGLAALRASEPAWCAKVDRILDLARRTHYY
mmetsp:Transcript_28877/g.73714  ORF Transcript_28877/g.73714 Transcript_28877/m.73714 type:complete len:489 (-) Transcript_28877:453-1919(-)